MIGAGLSEMLGQLGVFDYLFVLGNLVVIFFGDTLVTWLSAKDAPERTTRFRSNALRGLAMLCIALLGYYHFYRSGQLSDGIAIRLLSILVLIYLGYLTANFVSAILRVRYGRRYTTAGAERIADTYTSRALSIFSSIFLTLLVLISVIRIAGFNSLLEAGGVLGIVGVFLALTQGAWAPDIISGLIILNSKMFQERDVIKLNDSHETFLGTVYRTRAFHTELRNMVDNHRVSIRNSRIRDYNVHNLSRFASARGLRETLRFKIGYDVSSARVKTMFENAYQSAIEDEDILLEGQYPLEVRVLDTGDHAIEWSVHYYTKEVSQLVKTSQLFREKILNASIDASISLSTPITYSGSTAQALEPQL